MDGSERLRVVSSRIRPVAAAVVATLAMLIVGGGAVSADQVYHSERLPLMATGLEGHPDLRSGHVVNIHPNGPVNGALERYMVNGAAADTSYDVVIVVYTDATCTDVFMLLPTTSVQTDALGIGHGQAKFTADDLLPFSGAQLFVHWELRVGEAAAYETDCTEVNID
jgi:hypothetical protein